MKAIQVAAAAAHVLCTEHQHAVAVPQSSSTLGGVARSSSTRVVPWSSSTYVVAQSSCTYVVPRSSSAHHGEGVVAAGQEDEEVSDAAEDEAAAGDDAVGVQRACRHTEEGS